MELLISSKRQLPFVETKRYRVILCIDYVLVNNKLKNKTDVVENLAQFKKSLASCCSLGQDEKELINLVKKIFNKELLWEGEKFIQKLKQ